MDLLILLRLRFHMWDTGILMVISRLGASMLAGLLFSTIAFAQQPAGDLVARAFEPYEAIRVALSADKLGGIAEPAAALMSLAEQLSGPDAAKAAERLSQAKDLKAARDAFGQLSEALVPKFLEAKLPDVFGFRCSMVKLPWVQRGERVQNPYMGKSMSTCGEKIRKMPDDYPNLPVT